MSQHGRAFSAARLHLLFFALTAVYAVAFADLLATHRWLWDQAGHLQAFDFVDVYAAGKLALSGHPWAIYDWAAHRGAEAAALGHPVSWKDYYGWHYPPPFLFIATALAVLPYLVAFFAWSLGTLPLYLLTIRKVTGHSSAWLAACAFPATFFTIAVGQNGFLTAALMGGALLMLDARPVLAGLLIGLLAYKPQFGILIPLALIAGGHWRGFVAAATTVIAVASLSWLVHGSQTWAAFFHSVPVTVDAVLVRGMAGWGKLNSVYGLCRWMGCGLSLATALQGATIVLMALAVILLWRSRAPSDLKAAALIVASLIATPYLYVYDLPVLAVALAFLFRMAAFDRIETGAAALAAITVAVFPLGFGPTALAGIAMVALMILRRAGSFIHAEVVWPPCFAMSQGMINGTRKLGKPMPSVTE